MIKNLITALLIFTIINVQAKEIYVSPQGNDDNSGTIDAPFKTIKKALASLSGQGSGSVIWLRDGFHHISETVEFTGLDGGNKKAPLVISSYPGEQAIISGGVQIPLDKFSKVRHKNDLKRIHINGRDKVYKAKLGEDRYKSLFPGKDKFNESALVSWNGFVLNEAQFPNRGFAYITDVLEKGPSVRLLTPLEKPEPYSEANPSGGKFKVRESIDWNMMSTEFARSHDMQINGYFHNDWHFTKERIGAISNDGIIQLLRYTLYGIEDNHTLPRRVNIVGALCQLDEPGEWYYDKAEKELYVWPVQPLSKKTPITIAGSNKLFLSDGVDYVNFEHIIFENYSGRGIHLVNSNYISVLGCEFRSANGVAVVIDGTNNLVKSCDFHDLYQPVVLGSSNIENIKNLVDENNTIENCHIYNCSVAVYGSMGAGVVGGRFAHNLVHNMNGSIDIAKVDGIIEYNEIYDMGYKMGDWNCISLGNDYYSYGNQVRFNFLHHFMQTPGAHGVSAIRNDEGGQGLNFHHNVVYKTGSVVCQFDGPMNRMKDNIVMETSLLWGTVQKPYVKLDKSDWLTKGDFLATRYQTYLDNQEKIANKEMHLNEKFNYLGRAEEIFGKEGWKNNTLWLTKYPFMTNIYNFDDIERNPWMQCYDTIANNYVSGVNEFPFYAHGYNKLQNIDDLRLWMPKTALIELPQIINPEELFVNSEGLDFNFKPGMSIPGLSDFDFFEEIGLYVDEYRTELPNKNAYRKAVADKYKGLSSSGGTLDLDVLNKRYDAPLYLELVSEHDLECK